MCGDMGLWLYWNMGHAGILAGHMCSLHNKSLVRVNTGYLPGHHDAGLIWLFMGHVFIGDRCAGLATHTQSLEYARSLDLALSEYSAGLLRLGLGDGVTSFASVPVGH